YQELTAPSGLVAELFREEYARHGLPTDRLLVSSFALLDPWWTLRGACVPYWTPFPVEPAAAALERWLDRAPPFGRIDALLFAHGVPSVGLADVARWRGLLARAERPGELLGVDPRRWPCDLAVYARYHGALRAALGRYPLLPPPPLEPLLERLA